MEDLAWQIARTVDDHHLFARGERILVAVSGGVDSMVLLRLLHGLAKNRQWRLFVAHLNHRLRGASSNADARLVRRVAQELRVPVVVASADVKGRSQKQKSSVEMAARKARHEFLARTARRLGIHTIALAHHGDDQVELFLLRLLRGSGGEGLSGMRWRNSSPADPRMQLVRPLLEQPKSALRAYAAEHSVPFREDASNTCLEFQRNRIRQELVPTLKRAYQPAIEQTIGRVIEIVGAEADFIAETALEWLKSKRILLSRRDLPRHGMTNVPQIFDQLHVAVQRRCLQLQLIDHGLAPNFELVEKLRKSPGQFVSVGVAPGKNHRAGLFLYRDKIGQVHLEKARRSAFDANSSTLDLSANGGEAAFDGLIIRWRIKKRTSGTSPKHLHTNELFDFDKVGKKVLVRHWQPGDRLRPIGMGHTIKLQDFFTNEKVPRQTRRELVVATNADGEIFWVEGLRIAERFKLTKATIRCLHWSWERL